MTNTPEDFAKVRRHDRAEDDDWTRALLERAHFGTMATAIEGQPFLVTRTYVYDQTAHAIYMHGAQKGLTIENLQANDRVCFTVNEMGRLLPNERAMEFSVEFAGAVVFGRASIVTDVSEAKHGLQLLCDKYFPHLAPGEDYETATDIDLKVTAVIRIDIDSWSGKQTKAPENFPGAFLFDDVQSVEREE